MNLKITLLLILLFQFTWEPVVAQETLSLKTCHDSCEILFPLANQREKLMEINQLNKQVIQSRYLPTLDLLAKASYQSEVVVISVDVPGVNFPEMPKEQYSANIEIKQLIYDGGRIKGAKHLADAKTNIEQQQLNVDLFQLKDQINTFYFQALLLQESASIIDLLKETLKEQSKELQSAVDAGTALASQLDQISVELLKLEQQSTELAIAKQQAFEALSILSCFTISNETALDLPDISKPEQASIFRPEHQLFINQTELLDAQIALTKKNRMPTILAFANAGYGKPGYDFFNNSMHGYYLLGGQLKWNIWDWKKTQREKQQINLQKQIIVDQKDSFDKNLSLKISKVELNKHKLDKLIASDKQIIALQENISKTASTQMTQGTITTAEYLRQINTEKQARINLLSHKIQRIQTDILAQQLRGKINFNE